MIVTASLTSGIACVAHGMTESVNLIDEIIRMDHAEWETILLVGTVEFHSSKAGPFPNLSSESAFARQQASRH